MKLTTIRTRGGTRAARAEGDGTLVELPWPDVGTALRDPRWRSVAGSAAGCSHEAMFSTRAPLVLSPGRILCVGRLSRTASWLPVTLAGSRDAIFPPPGADADCETHLAVVLGAPLHRGSEAAAAAAIAGFSILTAITTSTHGTLSFGPALATPDELPGGVRPRVVLREIVDGALVREAPTAGLDPVDVLRRLSHAVPLQPGDVIAVGVPGGPRRHLGERCVLETEIDEIGFQENELRQPVQEIESRVDRRARTGPA
ncbi:fumarylacetoacetate hydrolase family protein [Amycolatopsis sp. NPDC051903]|uniref:fumarylacetoacetate hydrolase family protein n=1 Tax=Amycolatopsis sp. NPDC051903 TaxID=3363936 RepID=UPI0037BC6024